MRSALPVLYSFRRCPYAMRARLALAASGQVLPELLARLQAEPFLHQPPPKSTGRDLFNPAWLTAQLADMGHAAPQDVQATLTELTANACASSVSSYGNNSKTLAICGGGAFNRHLMHLS